MERIFRKVIVNKKTSYKLLRIAYFLLKNPGKDQCKEGCGRDIYDLVIFTTTSKVLKHKMTKLRLQGYDRLQILRHLKVEEML